MTDLGARASSLLALHTDPEILVLANVWDVVSARVVATTPGAKAIATASHSIASTFGYADARTSRWSSTSTWSGASPQPSSCQ